jgi:hypothetical protein
VPAPAWVHRRDELERAWEVGLARGARDDDATGLERLAQCLERDAREFRQFIEEEHAAVRERRFAGRGGELPPTSAAAEAV